MEGNHHALCLSMIVKNEAPVIARCLASVRPIIDYWVIVDTGSTDGTQDAIRTLMADLPGELHERPWRDFAHNRTEALELARPHGEYVLIIDADDVLEFEPQFKMPPLRADSYMIRIAHSSIRHYRVQIVKAALPWRWRGVLHEFLDCDSARSSGLLEGLRLRVFNDGARRRDPRTYRRDAEILHAALQTESDPFIQSRYQFYLAQSYRDCGETEKAVQAYLKRAELGFWIEEVFMSLYSAAKLQQALERPFDEVMATYLRAANTVPSRVEALHGASRYCRLSKRYKEGYEIAKRANLSGEAPDGLFVESWIYEYGLLDEFAVNAYWAGAYQDCLDACERILLERKCPDAERPRIEANAAFARQQLGIGNVTVSVAGEKHMGIDAPPKASVNDLSARPADLGSRGTEKLIDQHAPIAAREPRCATVVAVSPTGYVHAAALAEVAETVLHGLRRLGYDATLTSDPAAAKGRTVLVGAHLLADEAGVPGDAIIYNTEHVESVWIGGASGNYRRLLREHEVWDYSANNAALLTRFLGKCVRHVPLGYVAELTRIAPASELDIDVLFYGSKNPRRDAVLDQLRQSGLAVEWVFDVYGEQRDALIARSKIVLSMHYYLPGMFDIVRVSYAMANRKVVIAEVNPGEDVDADLLPGIVAVPYERLAEACRRWVNDDNSRRELEKIAFRTFSARDMTKILRQHLVMTSMLSERNMRYQHDPTKLNRAHLGPTYIEFMTILNSDLHPRSYFEVGTSHGESMNAFTCDAVCVDPVFRIDRNVIGTRRRSFFFQMTADDFFADYDLKTFFAGGVDIAFLDGMHRFEYLLRDFINTEKQCHSRSIILLHDCLPTNERMAERVFRIDEAEDQVSRYAWTGDVWRILPALRKYRPDLRVILLDCPPTGLVACTKLNPSSEVLDQHYHDIVDAFMDVSLGSFGIEQLRSIFPMINTAALAANRADLTSLLSIC